MTLLACIIDCKDWILLTIGFIITLAWTLFWAMIIYRLKPNINVESVEFEDGFLRINVINNGRFNATNLKIEACGILISLGKFTPLERNTDPGLCPWVNTYSFRTLHFKLDKEDFIFLPPKNRKVENDDSHIRTFKSNSLSEHALLYQMTFDELIHQLRINQQCWLRVRIHACHELSGFGRAFEFQFQNLTNRFIKIKDMPIK